MIRRKLALAASILAACDAGLTSPDSNRTAFAEMQTVPSAARVAASLIIAVPGQLVTLERGRGDTERAWVQARIVMDVIAPDGTAEMDGAILVVAAADGRMPQTNRDAETLQIDFQSGRIDADGIIHFVGAAILRDENGKRTFEIAGSARREAGNPDCIIWDILGGPPYDGATFETEVVLIDTTGLLALDT